MVDKPLWLAELYSTTESAERPLEANAMVLFIFTVLKKVFGKKTDVFVFLLKKNENNGRNKLINEII